MGNSRVWVDWEELRLDTEVNMIKIYHMKFSKNTNRYLKVGA